MSKDKKIALYIVLIGVCGVTAIFLFPPGILTAQGQPPLPTLPTQILPTTCPYRDLIVNGVSFGRVSNLCGVCDLFALIKNVFDYILAIAATAGALMLAYGGLLMILPYVGGGDSSVMQTKGKKVLTRAVVGILIIFFAWLAIDTTIKILANQVGGGGPAQIPTPLGLGPWNAITCNP